MRYSILLFGLQLALSSIFAQVRGVVLDAESQQPIPYANIAIEGKSYGTTSNLKGEFVITESPSSGRVVISAIGYSTALVDIDGKELVVILEPRQYQIDAVVVRPRRNRNELVVDKLSNDASNSFACNGYAWINAKFFEPKPEYTHFPFVKQIRILTRSAIRSAKFNVRLLKANENGEPGEEILNQNLIATARLGKRSVTIDLTQWNIQFPSYGLFVALEWLIIDDNRYEFTYTIKDKKGKHKGIWYEPKFIVYQEPGESNTWGYHGGTWYKRDYIRGSGTNRSSNLAIELLLTD
ncbi:MAG: carboxypeptidase-like regulatory domain-containing protein [Tenuifilaceae bacterium]|jgi:hypothetical protein|nr:carboxypeptidase-like regulatory domain-containing protein [Tenuifilaceae bacterium]